eukprot:tig00020554_g10866.t1
MAFVGGVTPAQLCSRSSGFLSSAEKATRIASAGHMRKARGAKFSVSAVTINPAPSKAEEKRGRVLQSFFNKSEELYLIRSPTAKKVLDALAKVGERPRNDHIAFRSFGYNGLGITALEELFLEAGFKRMEQLYFPDKHLRAHWYKPPQPEQERVFISELIIDELSAKAQGIIKRYLDEADPAARKFGILSSLMEERPWPTPSAADFDALAAESEYASWTLMNAYAFNHVTVAIHDLKELNTIEKLNQFLKDSGFLLNNAGGEFKTSPDGLLRQSSTVADKVRVAFADGTAREIPGSYIEFAERLVLPQFAHLAASEVREEHRRDGFEVANADKIFESTYDEQIKRK